MAKGVVTADWHIGVKTHSVMQHGWPSRWLDVYKSANFIVDYAIKNNADFFWVLGDLFHTNHPTPSEIALASKVFGRLEDAGIRTIVFDGNHDYVAGNKHSAASVLQVVRDWKNVDFYHDVHCEAHKDYGIKIVPHGCNLEEPRNRRSFNREFLLCHTTFDGCVVGSENFMMASHVKPPPKGVDVDMVLSGHIHKAQRLVDGYGERVDVIYPGSIERVDFGEEKEDKVFGWLDTETMNWEDVIIPARKMLTIRSKATAIADFESEVSDLDIKDRIVRIIMENDNLSKSQLEEAVKQHGPHIISQVKVSRQIQGIKEPELENIFEIDEKQLVEQIIREKIEDEQEILRAMEIVKEIEGS